MFRLSDCLFASPTRFCEKKEGEEKKLWCNIASCVRVVQPDMVKRERAAPTCKLGHVHVAVILSQGGEAVERVSPVPCVISTVAIAKGSELVAVGDPAVWMPAEKVDAPKRQAGAMLGAKGKVHKAEDPMAA